MQNIQLLLSYLMDSNFVVLFISILVSFFYRKKIPSELKYMGVYLFICSITELSLFLTMKFNSNNLLIVPIFASFEFLFFSYLFNKLYFKKLTKFFLSLQIIGFIFLLIINFYSFFQIQATTFQAYGKVFVNVFVIFYTLKYFMALASGHTQHSKNKLILALVLFLYNLFGSIFFISINFLINEDNSLIFLFWLFYFTGILLFYLSILFLTWRTGKTHKYLQFG